MTPSEITVPVPATSSSGPRWTKERTKKGQRHNPLGTKKWKIGLRSNSEEGWDQTCVRFRTFFDGLYSVHNGQPSGGLLPETALAKVKKFVKEDLKQSVSSCFLLSFDSSFYKFVNLVTAASRYEDRRGKAFPGCRGLLGGSTRGDPPGESNSCSSNR